MLNMVKLATFIGRKTWKLLLTLVFQCQKRVRQARVTFPVDSKSTSCSPAGVQYSLPFRRCAARVWVVNCWQYVASSAHHARRVLWCVMGSTRRRFASFRCNPRSVFVGIETHWVVSFQSKACALRVQRLAVLATVACFRHPLAPWFVGVKM